MKLCLKLSSVILPLFCPSGIPCSYLMLYWCLPYIEVIQINLQRRRMSLHPTSIKFLSLFIVFSRQYCSAFLFLCNGPFWSVTLCVTVPVQTCNFQANFSDWWLWWMSLVISHWWYVNIGFAMVLCCQATSHYQNQCFTRFMSSYGITRPEWINYIQNIYRYQPYNFTSCSTDQCP